MDVYLRGYLRTRDGAHLRRILPWAVSWPTYRRAAPRVHHSRLDALSGMRATRLALLLDAHLRGDLPMPREEESVLRRLAQDTAAQLTAADGIQAMNHGYFQAFGLELLARVLSDEKWSPTAHGRAVEAFNELVSIQFTDEGIHVENSPKYHWYAVDQINRSGALDRLASPETLRLVRRAETAAQWLTFPDGQIADVGDSTGPGRPFTNAGANVRELRDERYAVAPLWRSGYGIVRSLPDVPAERASMLLLTGTSRSHTHSHADKLSFELFEHGRRLLVDSGKYGYVRDSMRGYVESAVAHSTVGLDDHVIRRTDVMLDATHVFEPTVEDDAFTLSGVVGWRTAEYAFVHRRELVYQPSTSLVVRDTLASEAPQRYVSRLHFERSLAVRRDGSGLTVDLGDGRTMSLTAIGGEVSLHRGETDPLKGWVSVGYSAMEPTTMVELAASGTHRVLEWHLTF